MAQVNRIFAAMTIAVAGMALTSCASKEAYSGEPEAGSDEMRGKGPRVVQATPAVEGAQADALGGPGAGEEVLTEDRLVFFDFDKYAVKDEFLPVIQAHVEYMVANRNARVILQGHADERGSTEYNLALGQRRADAVREVMESGGVFPDQLEAVSYGEERPRALGSNEAAWAENRRVEIVYSNE